MLNLGERHKSDLMKISNLNFYFYKKVLCLFFFCTFFQILLFAEKELEITENTFFEIVGTDLESTQYVNELSNYVAKSILSDLYLSDYLPARRILVQLLNTENGFRDTKFYELSISDLGFLTVNIQWNESLQLPMLIEALTVSFIQSFGYSIYGDVFLDKYPSKAWLLKGLSSDIYIKLRPNVIRVFYKQAIIDGFEPVHLNGRIFDTSVPSDAQSFGFYRYTKSNLISRKDRIRILQDALLGKDFDHSIYSSSKFESEESMQNNLSEFLKSQYRITFPKFENLNASKSWLESLGEFSSFEIEPLKGKHSSLHLLWVNREDPSIVQFIEARILLISLALNEINPIYYNAAQSLALTYQKILDGVEEWELLYYFSDYLSQFEKANTVSLQISKQLQPMLP